MAKQRFGINDAYRGTVGTVIGYEWRGKWCLRSRPLRVRNPRTAKQQSNRLLFKQVVDLAGRMKMALRKGMHVASLAEHMTECNLFVKRNKGLFALEAEGEGQERQLAVDWESLAISEGQLTPVVWSAGILPATASGSMPAESRRSIVVPFAPCAEEERASGDDEVYVWAYCPEAGEGVLSAPAYRRAKQVEISLPERWQEMTVHLYGFAMDYRGEASPTTYIGTMETVRTIKHVFHRYGSVEEKHNDYGTERLPQGPRFQQKRAETECISGHQGHLRTLPQGDTRANRALP